jgi:hypothetical protein
MTQTRNGAGELRTHPSAADRGPRLNRYRFDHSAPAQPTPRHDPPVYSPLGVRRCAICGQTDRWQRIAERGLRGERSGGWYCCWPYAPRTYLAAMQHACTAGLCAHGRGAA